jgi:hypothetical protein
MDARVIRLAPLLEFDLAHRIAHRPFDLVVSIGDHRLKIFVRGGTEHARLIREAFADALRRKRRASVTWVHDGPAWPVLLAAASSPLIESNAVLLCLHELAESARRPHPERDGVGFGLMVVGDPGGSGELGSHALDGHKSSAMVISSSGFGWRPRLRFRKTSSRVSKG